jgi:hypothetical protein
MTMKDDDIIRLIENFKFDAGPVAVERRNRGFTLIHAETGVPIARLRPIGRDDLVDILYWSLWKERWVPFGPFGRTATPVEQAVRIVSEAAIFWAGVCTNRAKIRKVELRRGANRSMMACPGDGR